MSVTPKPLSRSVKRNLPPRRGVKSPLMIPKLLSMCRLSAHLGWHRKSAALKEGTYRTEEKPRVRMISFLQMKECKEDNFNGSRRQRQESNSGEGRPSWMSTGWWYQGRVIKARELHVPVDTRILGFIVLFYIRGPIIVKFRPRLRLRAAMLTSPQQQCVHYLIARSGLLVNSGNFLIALCILFIFRLICQYNIWNNFCLVWC
jgi:hypothetical protein